MKKAKIILIGIISFIGSYCFGQPAVPNEISQEKLNNNLADPSSQSNIQSPISDFKVNSTLEDKSAELSLGYQIESLSIITSLSQSFDDKSDKTSIFDLKGLGSGTTFKLGLKNTFWNPTADQTTFDNIRNAYAGRNGITNVADIRAITFDSIYKYITDIEKRQLENTINFKTPVIIGIDYSASKSDFNFTIDTLNFEGTSESKISDQWKIFAGIAFGKRSSNIVAASFSYQQKYEGNNKITVGVPYKGNAQFYLKDIVFGGPDKSKKKIYTIEYKRLFLNKNNNPVLAINPSVSIVTDQDNNSVFSFLMPLFFLREKNNDNKITGVNGGVSIGYFSSTNKFFSLKEGFDANVFIAIPFAAFSIYN